MASIKASAVLSLRGENLHDSSVTVARGAERSVWVVVGWEIAQNLAAGMPPSDLYLRSHEHVDSPLLFEFHVKSYRVGRKVSF